MPPTNIPDLTARQLYAVLAVAEYNSFIAAAAFLKTSQPALSRTIKRVEDIVGVRLFDRSTRRIAITTAGREFVAVAERMLNDSLDKPLASLSRSDLVLWHFPDLGEMSDLNPQSRPARYATRSAAM